MNDVWDNEILKSDSVAVTVVPETLLFADCGAAAPGDVPDGAPEEPLELPQATSSAVLAAKVSSGGADLRTALNRLAVVRGRRSMADPFGDVCATDRALSSNTARTPVRFNRRR